MLCHKIYGRYRSENTGVGETQIDMSKNDGIFALAADKFKWHFNCFGWVWDSATH